MISTAGTDQEQAIMDLFTKDQLSRLITNGESGIAMLNCIPVVHLHSVEDNHQWLVVSVNPENIEVGFGLIDIGVGQPTTGTIDVLEIKKMIAEGKYIFNNIGFYTEEPLTRFSELASEIGVIVADIEPRENYSAKDLPRHE